MFGSRARIILSLPLAVLSVLGVCSYSTNPYVPWFLGIWWGCLLFLCRDRSLSVSKGLSRSCLVTAYTWTPMGIAWGLVFVGDRANLHPWDHAMVVSLLTLVCAGLQCRHLKADEEWLPKPFAWLLLVIAVWTPYHLALPLFKIWNFEGAPDVAFFHSTAYSVTHGGGLRIALESDAGHFLGGHFSPALYLLFSPYFVWPNVAYLVGLSTVLMICASLALYSLAAFLSGSGTFAAVLAIGFLIHPMAQGVHFSLFHMVTVAPVLLFSLALVWARASGKVPSRTPSEGWSVSASLCFGVLCLGVLALKEDLAVILSMTGLAMVLSLPRGKAGWAVLGVAAGWAILAVFVWIPSFNEAGHYTFFDRLRASSGEGGTASLSEHLQGLLGRVANGDKLRYLGHMTIPFAALWVAGRQWLLPSLPVFAWIALSTNWIEWAFFPSQYAMLPLATLFLATAWAGFRKRAKGKAFSIRSASYLLLVCSWGFHLTMAPYMLWSHAPAWAGPTRWSLFAEVDPKAKELKTYLEEIPVDATVWLEPCHSFFVSNPLNARLIPKDEPASEGYPFPSDLYLVIKHGNPGCPTWAQELLDRPEGEVWERAYDNPFGVVFRRRG